MLLRLLQLADSALPMGATAHSFGLETLLEEGFLSNSQLEGFLAENLRESGVLEASYLRRAWRGEKLAELALEFEARRPARESREASFKLGRRFAELVNAVSDIYLPTNLHYPIAFGAACAALGISEEAAALAYLQQSVTGLVSVCQRLIPVGQIAASRILWNLGPVIAGAVRRSETLEVSCFSPLPELGSMRHPSLETRLFIS